MSQYPHLSGLDRVDAVPGRGAVVDGELGEEVDRRAERGLKPVDWAGVVVARVRDDEDLLTGEKFDPKNLITI